MQDPHATYNPYSPPTAEIREPAASPGARRPAGPRPIGIWMLQALLAAMLGLFLYGYLKPMLSAEGLRLALNNLPVLVFGLVLRLLTVAAVLGLIRLIHRGRRAGRWLAAALIAAVAVLSVPVPDGTYYANDAERAGGFIARYVVIPLVMLWWLYSAAFSRKARRHFS